MVQDRFLPFKNPELNPNRVNSIQSTETIPSTWQMWKSNFDTTLMTSVVGGAMMLNTGLSDRMNGSPVLQPDELRNLGIESDTARTPLEAVISNVIQMQKRKNEFITQNQGLVSSLSSGLAGSLLDMPLYAASEGVIRGTGNWALRTPQAKALLNTQVGSNAMRFFNETFKGALLKGGAINALSAAVIENPIMEQVAKRVGYDFTEDDKINNIMYSAFFGGLFEVAGKYIDDKRIAAKHAAEFEDFKNGKTPSDTSGRVFDNERFGDAPKLEFQEAGPRVQRKGKVYSAHVSPSRDFDFKTQKTFDSKLGEGIVATTNREIARGEVTSSILQEKGQILELDLADVNLLDADVTMPVELRDSIVSALEVVDKGLAKKVKEAQGPTRDIIETLEKVAERKNKPEISQIVQEKVKEAGYDGYEFRHKDSTGGFRGADTDRAIHVFDKDKFTLTNVDDQAGRDIPRPNDFQYEAERAEMQRLLEPSSDLFYDDAVFKELDNQPIHLEMLDEWDIDAEKLELDSVRGELEAIDLATEEGRKASVSLLNKEVESLERISSITKEEVSEVAKASEFCNRG